MMRAHNELPHNVRLEYRYTRERFDELYQKISRFEMPMQNEVFEAHRGEWTALIKKLVMFYEQYGLM